MKRLNWSKVGAITKNIKKMEKGIEAFDPTGNRGILGPFYDRPRILVVLLEFCTTSIFLKQCFLLSNWYPNSFT